MPKSKESLSLFWLARYRPYPMVILSGILLVLSFPPFPFAFLIYVAFVPLLLVIDNTPDKVFEDRFWGRIKAVVVTLIRIGLLPFWGSFHLIKRLVKPGHRRSLKHYLTYRRKIISHNAEVFRYAYVAFVIWNVGCCYWLLLTSVGVSGIGETAAALSAGLVANLVNPFLMTIPIYLYTRARKGLGRIAGSLSLVIFWVSFEWLHFNWELTWSWLTLGHAMSLYPENLQYMEYTGILGVSFQIMMVNALVYGLLNEIRLKGLNRKWYAGGIAVMIGLPFLLNVFILNPERQVFQPTGTLNVRVVQPNIDPYEKHGRISRQDQLAAFVRQISEPGIDSIELVVMPESVIPKGIWTDQVVKEDLLQPLWELVEAYNFSLLAGMTEFRFFPKSSQQLPVSARPISGGYYDAYNASVMMNVEASQTSESGVRTVETHQKAKLVPMVERMPFLGFVSSLQKFNIDLAGNFGNYGLPDSSKNLSLTDGRQVASLVCYESEFGDYVREFTTKGADVLAIITNDGWWQKSSGYIQHAHFTTLRAIENRREVIRSANTGISLYSDNRGNLYQLTDYWVEDRIDRKVNLYDSLTFYVKNGDYIGWISAIGTAIVILLLVIRRIRPREQAHAGNGTVTP